MTLASRNAAGRRILAVFVMVVHWITWTTAMPAHAQEQYSEDEVKAAFLYRFAAYVQWPEDAATGPAFTIGVLGADGIADKLQLLLPDRSIQGRPARLKRINDIGDARGVQILYVGRDYRRSVEGWSAKLAALPILVVTDSERGLGAGGVVNFLMIDRRVRFEVSLAAAEEAGLKISAELLSVATRVHRGNDGTDASCFHRGLPDLEDRRCIALIAFGTGSEPRHAARRQRGTRLL
jgi:hypothetical protein